MQCAGGYLCNVRVVISTHVKNRGYPYIWGFRFNQYQTHTQTDRHTQIHELPPSYGRQLKECEIYFWDQLDKGSREKLFQ